MRAESAPTAEFESLWLPPVPIHTQLPVLAAEGQLCFVQDHDAVYVYLDQRWMPLGRRATRTNAPERNSPGR